MSWMAEIEALTRTYLPGKPKPRPVVVKRAAPPKPKRRLTARRRRVLAVMGEAFGTRGPICTTCEFFTKHPDTKAALYASIRQFGLHRASGPLPTGSTKISLPMIVKFIGEQYSNEAINPKTLANHFRYHFKETSAE